MPTIDAHQHFLDIERLEYAWLRHSSPVYRDWTPADLRPEPERAGVDCTLLVQAADDEAETASMLETASAYGWVAGVVGWIPLSDPAAADAALERHAREHPKFRGVRHLLHLEPDPDWVVGEAVIESLGLLAARGLTFEVSVAGAVHLAHVPTLAERVPDLRLVIPHLGVPPIRERGWQPWAGAFTRAAEYPQVAVKLSRLEQAAGRDGATVADLQRYVDHALETFGPKRMMWASNWPVSLRYSDYRRLLRNVVATLQVLSGEERAEVLGGTAVRVYGLDPSAPYSRASRLLKSCGRDGS